MRENLALMNREDNLERARRRDKLWDIIVIGGGATGVGCALDAASRGYDVLLLEQHDFGKGTSSRSTKLVHGGVRYLAQGNISLVRESLKERGILLRNAPHVVHKQEFIVPCYSIFEKIFYGAGLKVYDLLARRYAIGGSRILSREETIERLPTVAREGLSGGVLYYDGQFDDTRLLIDMAVTADSEGACLLNYARVTGFLREDNGISGVEAFDATTGEFFDVRARSVINATGIFCDAVRQMSDEHAKPLITFSQGAHVVLDRKFLASGSAIMIPKTSDGRVLFCIPWLDHVIVGTTETPVLTVTLEPKVLDAEIDFILETAGEYLTARPIRNDILSVFAGIRPLVSRVTATNTASLSRSHELFVDAAGLVTITGGKWTTYRRMAEEAVNKAIEIGCLSFVECQTETLIVTPSPTISGERIHPDLPYTRDDLIRAVRDEMAQTVEDVLARRTRALFLNANAARELAPLVAEILRIELGRNESQIAEDLIKFEIISRKYMASR